AADLQAAEVDAGDAAPRPRDAGAQREVQGGQAAPAAGAHEVLPRAQNQPARVVSAAAAPAARLHLAVLHAAYGSEVRHLRKAAARVLLKGTGQAHRREQPDPPELGDRPGPRQGTWSER